MDKTAEGTDADSDFTDDETTAVDSTVTFRVIIDNDSAQPVTITSVVDDVHGVISDCSGTNFDGDDFDTAVGQTLAPDDGDGPGSMDGGPDEITCTFEAQAPSTADTAVTDVVTVEAEDEQENPASDHDDATIRTPVVAPAVLPPTGSLGTLMEDSSSLILFAVIGLTLIGGSAWIIWSNRRWSDGSGRRS